MKKRILLYIIVAIMVIGSFLNYFGILQGRKYTASEFGINEIKSVVDYNNNGVDDYTDILYGAKIDAKNKPKYKSEYYAGGYPPDNIGVCSDVIWRAFKNAGYSLKDMINNDRENKTVSGKSTHGFCINFSFRSPWGSWTAMPRCRGTCLPDCTEPSSPEAERFCQGLRKRWPGRRDGGQQSRRGLSYR